MKIAPLICILSLAASRPAWALHANLQIGTAMTNAEAALSLLYANPPLPMTTFRGGNSKATVMLDYFFLQKPASESGDEVPTTVSLESSMNGFGGAALYDYALGDRWSLYGLGLFARLGSGRLEGRLTDKERTRALAGQTLGSDDSYFQRADAGPSTSFGVSVGLNRKLIGEDPARFTLSAFFGPVFYYTRGSGTVFVLTDSFGNTQDSTECAETGAYPNLVCLRRGYTGSVGTFGILSGLQAGVPIAKSFLLNPYLLFMPTTSGGLLGFEDDIGADWIQLDRPIGKQSNTGFLRAITDISLGANLTYRPWGLTVNLTGSLTPYINQALIGLTDYRILKFQISKSFGNYLR